MNPLNRKAAVLYLLVTFVLGGVAGGSVGYSMKHPQPPPRPPQNQGPGQMVEWMVTTLTRDLSLTPDQVAKIRPIVVQNGEEFEKFQREHGEKMHEMFHRHRERLLPLLTPEQVKKQEELDRQRRHRWPPPSGPRHGETPPSSPKPDGAPSEPPRK